MMKVKHFKKYVFIKNHDPQGLVHSISQTLTM